MRVLLVINSLGAGGTERSTAVLLPMLRERGVDPIVVCLLHRDEGDQQRLLDAGFDVRVLGVRGYPARVRALRRIIAAERPDVVHTAIFEADIVGRLAAAGTGVPVLSSLVNTPYDAARLRDPNVARWKLRGVKAVDSWTARRLTAHFHAVTDGVARDAVGTLRVAPADVTVVERGRDPAVLGRRSAERRASVRARLGVADDAEMLLALGRQEFQKGHVHLVEAVAKLAPSYPQLVALVAGRAGNATQAIELAIDQHGVRDRVRLLGHRDDPDDLLAAADVFVLPSLYEGTAGAAIEALALEAPIVASELPGTRGILIDGETARLVPAGDAPALADAVAEVLREPAAARTRARAGRALFEARFTLERSAERMAALFTAVAALPARPRRLLRGRRRAGAPARG